MRTLRKILFIAPALALMGAFLMGAPSAGAQEREPGDLELSMTNRYEGNLLDGTFVVSVKNNSPATVRNIRVQFEVDDLTEGRTIYLIESKPISTSLDRNDGFVNVDPLEWVIPAIEAGFSATTRLETDQGKNARTTPDQPLLLRLRGSIVESSPPEAPGRLGNNQARTYVRYTYTSNVIARTILLTSIMYGVDADPDADTFTIKVRNRNRTLNAWSSVSSFQYQLRVRVTPSPGLSLAAAAPSGTSFNPATGIWDIGTLPSSAAPELEIRVTGRDARAGPAEDQCLTVEIEHIIPDLEEPYFPVTACMAHKALLLAGYSDLLTMYDCVSNTDYPCGSQPSLELVAVKRVYRPRHVDGVVYGNYDTGDVHRARFRSDVFGPGTSTNNMVLQPEEVVVQVSDRVGRRQQAGGKWRSPLTYLGPPETAIVPPANSDWRPLTFAVSDVSPKQRPGEMQFILAANGLVVLDPDAKPSFTLPNGLNRVGRFYGVFHEFQTLGTYRVRYTFGGTKSGATYTDSGIYTFHVGPVAELEVRDEPARSLADPGQRAYTIVARNQGPDTAPAVRVTLAGVPELATAIPSQGSYTRRACRDGLCEGVWTIGTMLDTASRYAEGGTEGEVLTIIPPAGAAGDPITATIENTQDYTVCIDSSNGNDIAAASQAACGEATNGSWHTTNYYDYLDHNNQVRVQLQPAPSAGPAGRPSRPQVARIPAVAWLSSDFTLVRWPRLEYLNGFRVSHYEVQRSANGPFETVAPNVGGGVYLDSGDSGGNAAYRVRAVNNAGRHGPWSLPSGAWSLPSILAPDEPANFRATLVTDTDVELTWAAPANTEAVTHYTIQASDHSGGPWSHLARPNGDAIRYIHRNLPATGATKYYRIRAHNRSSHSPWAEASVGLTTPPDDTAPTGLRAQRYTTREGNHGIQVWFTARYTCDLDATDCLTLIEYREVGRSAWQFGSESSIDYGIVPWDPDARYFTEGAGREHAVRLDSAYDIRVCKLTEAQLETKHAEGTPEGTWCVGYPTGQLRVPAGE